MSATGNAETCRKGNCVSVLFTSQCIKVWLYKMNIASCTVHTVLSLCDWAFLRSEQWTLVLVGLCDFSIVVLKNKQLRCLNRRTSTRQWCCFIWKILSFGGKQNSNTEETKQVVKYAPRKIVQDMDFSGAHCRGCEIESPCSSY